MALPPALLKNTEDLKELYWYQGLEALMREGYAEHGAYYLRTVFLGDPNTFWSKRPLRTIADLKGFKVRTYGYFAKVWAKLGATPTFIPHEEVYSSLAQGVIDGSQTAGSYFKRFKYYEVCPYYYLPGLAGNGFMPILISMQAWKKLPDDLKAILEEADLTKSKAFLRTFVKRIDIEGDTATIHYTLPVPPQGRENETVSVLPIETSSGEAGTRTPTSCDTRS